MSEQHSNADDVVRATGWVFNNETGSELTLEQFVDSGDTEVAVFLALFDLQDPANDQQSLVEIGCGIGRMTPAFTRAFAQVIACDLDAGFLERCRETVGRFGESDHLETLHVVDGRQLDLAANSVDVAFSYITLQHCEPGDALDLCAEAVRVTRPGGKVVLNFRSRSQLDTVIIPLSKAMRSLFKVPGLGGFLSRQRVSARLGWQANRLQPDDVIGPLSALLSNVEIWRHPKSSTSGTGAVIKDYEGINMHHYWVVATVR